MMDVRISEKETLTLKEAAALYNIGVNKLRQITNDENCNFVLWNGSHRLIKRRAFDEYIKGIYSI